MIYFYGQDTYAAREEIGKIAEQHKAVIRWLDEEDIDAASFSEWLSREGNSLLGVELMVLRDPSKLSKTVQSDIAQVVRDHKRTLCILWDRESPDKRSSLFRALREHSKEFPVPSKGELAEWIKKKAERSGNVIDDAAAREMVKRIGHDRWRLSAELEKLMLVRSSILLKDVSDAVPEANIEEEVFAMLDAMMAGNAKRAIEVMESLLEAGQSEFYILTMLAYQFRTLITIQAQLPYTEVPSQIATKGKLHPFVVEKNLQAARMRTTDEIIDSLTRILATDTAIKSGKVDARTALTMLVMNLARPVSQQVQRGKSN